MDQKPNRRWFQFHLSTAIALMFVCGLLIWANVRVAFCVGWPMRAVCWNVDDSGARNYHMLDNGAGLVYDAIVALLSIMWVAFIFEARARAWPGERILAWAFVGFALGVQLIVNLRQFITILFE